MPSGFLTASPAEAPLSRQHTELPILTAHDKRILSRPESTSCIWLAMGSFHSQSMRSILNMTGLVPSLQQAIMTWSSFFQPCMILPP